MKKLLVPALLLSLIIQGESLFAQSPSPALNVDWPQFMSRQDLVWEQLPLQWNEGAFVGNGQLGMMIYSTASDNRLDFHLGRADVTDHRKAPDRKTSMGVRGAGVMFHFPRLDVGRMVLRPAGKIIDGSMRLSLWNAETTGTIQTDLGSLSIRALTLRDRMVQVIHVTSTEQKEGQPMPWKWEFRPGNPDSPRAQTKPEQAAKENYQPNPPHRLETLRGLSVCVQPLLAGGDYATAWRELAGGDGRSGVLLISTMNEVPAAGVSAEKAVAEIESLDLGQLESLAEAHRKWWHDFYPQSFVTVPDARIESFYWIQQYKLGGAWRPDAPAIDLFGPWFRISQWPGIWWNLNIQLTYWPIYAANRLQIGQNYLDLVDSQFDTTFTDSLKNKIIGDFAWALHNYWWQLRFAGDSESIRTRWLPKARIFANGYLKRLVRNAEGRLELPQTGSPEYKGFAAYDNTNYNLGLLRWLLNALIEVQSRPSLYEPEWPTEKLPAEAAAEIGEWRQVLKDLVDYPVNANGLMIGSNQGLDESHRHFSHLLPLYPLYQLDPDEPSQRELLLLSMRHWHGIQDGKALAGYSFTGGAALYASLGLGNEALGMLNDFLDNVRGGGKVLPNTFYVESGRRNPVIETPLSAASSTLDLLLQSWKGKIRVFPAVPDAWPQAAFYQLRALDGFLVSASRMNSQTQWVSLQSEAGAPCTLKVRDWTGALRQSGSRSFSIVEIAPGEYRIDLKKGESLLVWKSEKAPEGVSALPQSLANPFGVKKGKGLEGDQFWPEVPHSPAAVK